VFVACSQVFDDVVGVVAVVVCIADAAVFVAVLGVGFF